MNEASLEKLSTRWQFSESPSAAGDRPMSAEV
jgi:hypothetical protein